MLFAVVILPVQGFSSTDLEWSRILLPPGKLSLNHTYGVGIPFYMPRTGQWGQKLEAFTCQTFGTKLAEGLVTTLSDPDTPACPRHFIRGHYGKSMQSLGI